MIIDLDNLAAVMQEHLGDLIVEAKRLREENAFLLDENRRLREQLTLHQLRSDIERMDEIEEIEDRELTSTLPDDAKEFFTKLPDRLTFADFFRIAELEELTDERARSLLTLYLKEQLLQQHGRRMYKKRVPRGVEMTT